MVKNTRSSKQELLFHYYQKLDNDETHRNPDFFYKDYQNPTYIQDNLRDKLRPYQAQSLRTRFTVIYYSIWPQGLAKRW